MDATTKQRTHISLRYSSLPVDARVGDYIEDGGEVQTVTMITRVHQVGIAFDFYDVRTLQADTSSCISSVREYCSYEFCHKLSLTSSGRHNIGIAALIVSATSTSLRHLEKMSSVRPVRVRIVASLKRCAQVHMTMITGGPVPAEIPVRGVGPYTRRCEMLGDQDIHRTQEGGSTRRISFFGASWRSSYRPHPTPTKSHAHHAQENPTKVVQSHSQT